VGNFCVSPLMTEVTISPIYEFSFWHQLILGCTAWYEVTNHQAHAFLIFVTGKWFYLIPRHMGNHSIKTRHKRECKKDLFLYPFWSDCFLCHRHHETIYQLANRYRGRIEINKPIEVVCWCGGVKQNSSCALVIGFNGMVICLCGVFLQ
jgi:hypothetical protein